MPEFDVVGVGLNATDTLLIVPHFPAYAGKVPFEEENLSPGGQVASAMVACARLGLRTKYIGAVGDDERGRIQMESLRGTGINLDHVQVRKGCPNQSAYIIIDRSTGERTVLWRRDDCLQRPPRGDHRRSRSPARACCTSTGTIPRPWRAPRRSRAGMGSRSRWMSTPSIRASTRCCPTSITWWRRVEFPAAWTGETDPFKALETIQKEYGMRVRRHDAGRARRAGARGRQVLLLAGFRGELCGYHRRRRRVSRGVLLCCFARHADARTLSISPMPWRP